VGSVPSRRELSQPAAPVGDGAGGGCRCACGSLLGRLVPEGVEIKCRRCKRTHVIPLEGGPGRAHQPRPEVQNPEPDASRARAGRGD
jgi:hypothetical protein